MQTHHVLNNCLNKFLRISYTLGMTQKIPAWLSLADELFEPIHKRMSEATSDNQLPLKYSMIPQEALWFFIGSMGTADDLNRKGMHAISLSLTRNCIESLSLIELGVSRHKNRASILEKWKTSKSTPGSLRKWLSENAWSSYGNGLWDEEWASFMGHLASAIQPYTHYTERLAQWQSRLISVDTNDGDLRP